VLPPGALYLYRTLIPNSSDNAEPSSQLLTSPPALQADCSLYLPDREHLAAHQDLHTGGVIAAEDLISLFLAQGDAHLVLVSPINIQFLLHVSDLTLDLEGLLSLALLPSLMLLLLDRLQSQRVVAKWVLYVTKVRQVRDDLFPADLSLEEFGSQSLTLLVVGEAHKIRVATILASVLNIGLGHIRQPLVYESAQL